MQEKYFRVAKTITPWKKVNRLENWLGNKADKSEFWKKVYVAYYKYTGNRKYYNKGIQLIDKEIERQMPTVDDPFNRLSQKWLETDMVYALHRFGIAFEEYFVFRFYDLNYIGRQKFNNMKTQYGYCEIVNNPDIRIVFDDKSKLYQLLKRYYKRELLLVKDKEAQSEVELNEFLSSTKDFIIKPLTGHSGIGIELERGFNGDAKQLLDKYSDYLPFVIEGLINQSDHMSLLHKESINTYRVITFTIGDEVNIVGTSVRMGRGKSSVDNAGSGGIYAQIDPKTGVVISIGMDNECNKFVLHPDTKTQIVGFQMPDWDEAMTLVREVAREVKKIGATSVAWDLAHSKDGWVIVEGNDVGGSNTVQAPTMIGTKGRILTLIDKYLEKSKM